ncbi:FAD-dependent oxidoreductase [Delftia sp. PS-11]|uniref:FAD-dependent oxidoreductase n=1 Tax=Delftia sp. PS-11 TaxID=2767222 RepID=UPI002458B40C|nr:FAD-dependent oxidoreductase [Delftia sp. PS-11]KAJ8745522.1 FAD-dependent oxidoreductase [Delftia sp. PS-11]
MTCIQNALVIGGGFSGMSAAIECAKQGIAVDLVEIDAQWRADGAGISVSAPTLRALQTVGVLDAVIQQGYCGEGVKLFTASGMALGVMPTPCIAGPGVPSGAGIMRPVLAGILAQATRAAGVNVRLACSFEQILPQSDGVQVRLTDGSTGRYDLVIAADGLYSKVRKTFFPDAPAPRYTGQSIWRAVVPRPADITTVQMWLGDGHVKVGVNPVSQDEMYVFVTEERAVNERIAPELQPQMLRDLLAPFSAPQVQAMRAHIGPQSRVVFRPLESMLMPRPWNSLRVVLVGDAVHATTPHLASGAGIGIEDGIVLAQELGRAASLDAALAAFEERRFERCRAVVESSGQLGEIEATGGDKALHAQIMRATMAKLAEPI